MEMNNDNTVNARPVKSFFVEMLTRDIDLVDAILDLLDNCVDGILRTKGKSPGEEPYKDFSAEITFDKSSFSISDNCGGIPQKFQSYAFRMGKESKDRETDSPMVGVYGIGMKRAIFKIGKKCSILTQNEGFCYKVEISPEWLTDSEKWDLPVSDSVRPGGENGTTIEIKELNENISLNFDEDKEKFTKELTEKVKTHYAFILNKGFEVKINGKLVLSQELFDSYLQT